MMTSTSINHGKHAYLKKDGSNTNWYIIRVSGLQLNSTLYRRGVNGGRLVD